MADLPVPECLEDLTGKQLGRLTVTQCNFYQNGKMYWVCTCSCGNAVSYWHNDLVRVRYKKSCGCAVPVNAKPQVKHGDYGSPEYQTWNRIKDRCTNPNYPHYASYGGRGISVCPQWLGDTGYATFLRDMGRRPSSQHSIDRIDPNGNYCPDNCRWATAREQANNQRDTVFYTVFGKTQQLSYWAEEYGRDLELVRKRLKAGWEFEKALTTPPRKKRPNGSDHTIASRE